MNLRIGRHVQGATLPVKARPGGKKNALLGEHDGALKITVVAAPEKGKANQAIVKLLAKHLGRSPSNIQLLRGAASSEKLFLICDISPDELANLLESK